MTKQNCNSFLKQNSITRSTDATAFAAYSNPSVYHMSVCHVVYCGQGLQNRPAVCIEGEQKYEVDISVKTIFNTLGLPESLKQGSNWGTTI